jgi:uncharacterized protein
MVLLKAPKAQVLKGVQIAASAVLALTLLAAPARAQEPSPAAIALALNVLTDIGLKSSVESIVPSMLGEINRNISQMHPEMKAALKEVITAAEPDFIKTDTGVLNDIATVLASRMTEQELKETAAFFESPTGKKYIAAQVPMLQEFSVSGDAWRQKLAGEMLSRIRDDLKKKGFSF